MRNVGFRGEEEVADGELGDDAANAPHVDAAAVVGGAEEELGRAVEARDDVVGHVRVGVCKAAGETEISEFDGVVGGDDDVVGFDVAVEDEVFVEPPHRLAEHVGPGLDVRSTIRDAFVFPDVLELAAGEVFENEVDVFVFRGEDGDELDEVGVVQLGEVLHFAEGVEVDAVLPLCVLLHLLDGDELGGVVAVVAAENGGVGSLAEAWAEDELVLDLVIHLLGEALVGVGGPAGGGGGAGGCRWRQRLGGKEVDEWLESGFWAARRIRPGTESRRHAHCGGCVCRGN